MGERTSGRNRETPPAEPQQVGRHEHALRGPSIVEGPRQLTLGFVGQDDGHRGCGGRQSPRLRQAQLGDATDGGRIADGDEPPGLLVAAAARPAGDLGDGVELRGGDGPPREVADLADPDEDADPLSRARAGGGGVRVGGSAPLRGAVGEAIDGSFLAARTWPGAGGTSARVRASIVTQPATGGASGR